MKLPIFQVDAFTETLFKGNPAAVVPLEEWPERKLMQSIAMENNLSETAFFVPSKLGFEIRWFTPVSEVKLCGHATLATAHVIFEEAGYPQNEISFGSLSGMLKVRKSGSFLQLDFPVDKISTVDAPNPLIQALGKLPKACYKGKTDYLLLYDNEKEIEELSPNFTTLAKNNARGIIATAPGTEVDFVSRFFAPAVGINEDPVTGSAHTMLTPFWAQKTGKKELKARQLSRRRGELVCTLEGDRVLIAGKAKTFLRGEIFV